MVLMTAENPDQIEESAIGRLRERLVPRATLADQVADLLVDHILESGLQPGDALPPTAELVAHLGVSRTVVREAIAELAGRGVLMKGQGRESIVASPGARKLHELLSFTVRHD